MTSSNRFSGGVSSSASCSGSSSGGSAGKSDARPPLLPLGPKVMPKLSRRSRRTSTCKWLSTLRTALMLVRWLIRRLSIVRSLFCVLSCLVIVLGSSLPARAQTAGSSVGVTATCTGSPCPSGSGYGPDQVLVWPVEAGATSTRLGYTTSAAVFAPASGMAGWSLQAVSGVLSVYTGDPVTDTSLTLVATLTGADAPLDLGSLTGSVFVYSASPFDYTITVPPPPTTTTTIAPTTTTTTIAPTTTAPSPTGPPSTSEFERALLDSTEATARSTTVLGVTAVAGTLLLVWSILRRRG